MTMFRTSVLLVSVALLTGCVYDANQQRPFAGQRATIAAEPQLPGEADLSLEPRALPLDRASWEKVVVRVPVDDPQHAPLYITRWESEFERSQAYPTPLSSVDAAARTGGLGRRDSAITVVYGFFDLVALVPRAIITPPWTDVSGPRFRFDRTRSETWLPEALGVQPEVEASDATIRRIERPAPDAEVPEVIPAAAEEAVSEADPEADPVADPGAEPEDGQ